MLSYTCEAKGFMKIMTYNFIVGTLQIVFHSNTLSVKGLKKTVFGSNYCLDELMSVFKFL